MDQNRWRTVNEIFHAALEVSSSERQSFVATAAKGDSDLQAEVESLLKADEEAGSYIESPVTPFDFLSSAPPMLQAGSVLCNRFRIDRSIAEGGMGQVFEAFDTELDVRVALKVIRPEIASDPEALERFRQEVRLARRITHPNVCRTFDIERDTRAINAPGGAKQTIIFLTMEYLEGETLASLIRRSGPLSADESLRTARQIAEALAAAHSLGVIHRDIKPANIMLVAGDKPADLGSRAVVTDFGLARLDPLISTRTLLSLSQTARPIGTLAYMAPEQLEGAAVSSATDIYAFGLVLFEMVTGKRAFPSENLLSGVAQRLSGPAPDPKSIVPNLPASWCRAIEGCLRTNPADRFQSAIDVIAVLEGGTARLRPARKAAQRDQGSLMRRLAGAAIILLVAVALLAVGLRLYLARAASGVSPGALVYLTQVSNQTGEKSFENLTELLKAGLAQSTQIDLLDQGRVGEILQQMIKPPETMIDEPVGREIAMRAGAVRVVFASLTGSNGSYALNIDIQQPDNTPTRYRDHWPKKFTWRTSSQAASEGTIPPELSKAVRDASDWIRHQAGESANDIARLDIPPEDVTTSNWQALSDYERAEDYARRRKRDDAVTALHSAIQHDPGFALAYARLGDIQVNLAHEDDGYRAYLKALDESSNRRLSLRERDRIRGIYALDTHDYRTSEEAFREYSALYDHDYLGWFYHAYPLSMLGQTDEAKKDLERAHAIAPDRVGPIGMLILENLIIGDLPEANRWEAVIKTMHDEDGTDFADGVIAFVAGDLGAADTAFRKMAHSSSPASSQSSRYLADLAAEEGNYHDAYGLLTKGIEDEGQDPQMLLDRAFAAGMTKNLRQCVDDVKNAVKKDGSPFTYLRASQILGELIARSDPSSFRPLKEALAGLDRTMPTQNFGLISDEARFRVHGELLLASGQTERALAELSKADKLEAPNIGREYLGRALEAVAARTADSSKSTELRKRAVDAYAVLALHPGLVWRSATEYPPGFYADNLEAWVHVAHLLGIRDSQYQTSLARLQAMRPGINPNDFAARNAVSRSSQPNAGAVRN